MYTFCTAENVRRESTYI